MNAKTIAILLTTLCCFFSCDKFDNDSKILESGTYEFTYNNKEYCSIFYMTQDSILVYENNVVKTIMEELALLPDLATFYVNDKIYYFPNKKLGNEFFGINEPENIIENCIENEISSKGEVVYDAELIMFKDTNFKGSSLTSRLGATLVTGSPDLDWLYGFNDCISSFRMSARSLINNENTYDEVKVTFYRDKDYGGYSLTYYCMAPYPRTIEVSSLKNVKMPNGKNWNDRISSFKFSINRSTW